jgi:nucleotide-binding universal stress UspA family protein
MRAVQHAAGLAENFGAAIILLHAVQLNIGGEEVGVPRSHYLNKLRQTARKRLRRLVHGMERIKIASRIIIGIGRPHLEIVKQAELWRADLIIMGAHGHIGWLRFLRPNTIAHVVRRATCPVLVVHSGVRGFVTHKSSPSMGSPG